MNPFRVKLTFAQRCAIFAGHWRNGYNYPDLSRAFGVNDETIGKICRSSARSRNYRDVFAESYKLGVERMWEQYSQSIDIEARIKQARLDRNFVEPEPTYLDDRVGTHWFKNSKNVPVAVKIKHGSEVPDSTAEDGFLIWSPTLQSWVRFADEPWESVGDVTRYLLMFPNELDDL